MVSHCHTGLSCDCHIWDNVEELRTELLRVVPF
jgi:hypothetical protein